MSPFGDISVLVVDPDEGDRDEAVAALSDSDTPGPAARVEAADSMDAATEAFDRRQFDCVVTEYDLPDTTGLELVAWVRDRAPDAACVLFTEAGPDAVRTADFEDLIVEYQPKHTPQAGHALARLVGNVVSQRSQIAYPLPGSEEERLAALERYDVEDLDAAESVDRITELVATHFDVAVAFAGVIDAHQERFLACHGADWESLDREDTICTHTILEEDYMIVEDVQADARFSGVDVLADLDIRSYAGVPLKTPEGQAIGALCLIDDEPRDYTTEEIERLQQFADELMEQLELRRRLREQEADR